MSKFKTLEMDAVGRVLRWILIRSCIALVTFEDAKEGTYPVVYTELVEELGIGDKASPVCLRMTVMHGRDEGCGERQSRITRRRLSSSSRKSHWEAAVMGNYEFRDGDVGET